MIALTQTTLKQIGLIALLVLAGAGACHAQSTKTDTPTAKLAAELHQFGDIDLLLFDGRDDFLSQIDAALGLGNIKNPNQTFAKLPRSPFTVTGRKGKAALATCRIFVPAHITPERHTEIFAELMRNWFGTNLSYASNPGVTFRWLIFHEVRHCQPDHFGGDPLKDHQDELAADLWAFEHLANEQNRTALAADIIAFRIITSTLFADPSHMIGLSLKRALETSEQMVPFTAQEEITAFQTIRQQISKRAQSIATSVTPTNRELIRAITELRHEVDQRIDMTGNNLVSDILVALDDAIAHFAPELHQSVANIRAN